MMKEGVLEKGGLLPVGTSHTELKDSLNLIGIQLGGKVLEREIGGQGEEPGERGKRLEVASCSVEDTRTCLCGRALGLFDPITEGE